MSLWGIFLCPKWFEILNLGSNFNICSLSLPFISPKIRAWKRIGPHNYDILSILIGSLLGDGYAERHVMELDFAFNKNTQIILIYFGFIII